MSVEIGQFEKVKIRITNAFATGRNEGEDDHDTLSEWGKNNGVTIENGVELEAERNIRNGSIWISSGDEKNDTQVNDYEGEVIDG